MKKISIIISALLLLGCGASKSVKNTAHTMPIHTAIDLTKVVDDKVPVIINPGLFTKDSIIYRLPKVIQGTYAVSDFGSFVEDFTAYDYDGKEMPSTKIDSNSWFIAHGKNLDRITYNVNDTFDIEGGDKPTPFSPSGTNIAEDNFVLNLHGFIGYFDLLKNNKYTLDVNAPSAMKRTSALQKIKETLSEDGKSLMTTYAASRYFDITDNPMMYGALDVEEFLVGDIKIVLSVYSPNQVHSAATIKETVLKMMKAQKKYLGDIDSTPRYDIYLYLAGQGEGNPSGFGALEHHTSTVVVLPEAMPAERLASAMVDVVSHEFFHIVTPLGVHSEDVHYFDYNAPTFSKHLWMYEGVTEYFATLFQINQALISEEEFYEKLSEKIQAASALDDTMSFTEMSENILDDPYAKNYLNVYQKGALIGMCIDILLREASNGERGILSLMKQLALKYGMHKPFVDDNLIAEITAMTYPSIGDFLKTHVEGNTPIDYDVYFTKTGLGTVESRVKTNHILNGSALIIGGSKEKQAIYFNDLVADNSFWVEQGVLPNDIIKEINGEKVSLENANQIFQQMFSWQLGKEFEMKLMREAEEVIIKTKLSQSYTTAKKLQVVENTTEAQNNLRTAWLKN